MRSLSMAPPEKVVELCYGILPMEACAVMMDRPWHRLFGADGPLVPGEARIARKDRKIVSIQLLECVGRRYLVGWDAQQQVFYWYEQARPRSP